MKRWFVRTLAALLACLCLPFAVSAEETISGNLKDFEMILDGVRIKLPCAFADLEAAGWALQNASMADLSLDAFTYTAVELRKGDPDTLNTIRVELLNNDVNAHPLLECAVVSVLIKFNATMKRFTPLTIAKGIQLQSSTGEDILAAYGKANETSDFESSGSQFVTMRYRFGSYQTVELKTKDGLLCEVTLTNHDVPKPETSISEETPDYIKNYVVPSELGDDLSSLIMEYEGDLYRMPAPVSAFLANGWEIYTLRAPYVMAGRTESQAMQLKRGDRIIDCTLVNLAGVATTSAQCAVMPPKIFDESAASLVLPADIKVGSTQDALFDAHESLLTVYSKGADEKAYAYTAKGLFDIVFVVDNQTKQVTKIYADDNAF